jgi:hypothetical protein
MSRLLPLLFFTLILLAIDLYAYQAVRTVVQNSAPVWKRLIIVGYWFISALSIGFVWSFLFFDFYDMPKWVRVYLLSLLFVFYVPKLVLSLFMFTDDAIRLGKLAVQRFSPPAESGTGKHTISRSQFLAQSGLVVSGFFLFQFVYGMVRTAFNYQVRRVKIPIANLPEKYEGFRIVQISDIHTGSFTSDHALADAVKLINEQNADAVFFTGDLVNNRSDEALAFVDTLKEIKARHGVFSIFGNHDYGDYYQWDSAEEKEKNLVALEEIHQQMGWQLLRNGHAMIGDEKDPLAIIGIDNWSNVGNFPKYGNLQKALSGAEHAPVKLLLSHDPSHWTAEVVKNFPAIDATFSGHTHGFQFGIEIPGLQWSPAQYMYPQWAGLYRNGRQSLYVNRGLGFLAYSGRVGIPPEITLVELTRA